MVQIFGTKYAKNKRDFILETSNKNINLNLFIVPLYERGCHEVTGDFLFRMKRKIVNEKGRSTNEVPLIFLPLKNNKMNNHTSELDKKDLIYIYQSI